jgi:soluble lytic murein transglycosylase
MRPHRPRPRSLSRILGPVQPARPPGRHQPARILDFLERQRGSWLAERLRGEWLRSLGKRGEWDTLAAEFPAMEQPEQDVKCYHLQARLGRRPAALDDARPLWFSLVDTPESCIPVLQALVREARVSPDETWSRVRRLMEAKRFAGARAVAAWLPADQQPAASSSSGPAPTRPPTSTACRSSFASARAASWR